MKRIINVIKKDNVSLLFSILGMELLFYNFYGVVNIVYILLIAILGIVYFMIYDKMSENKKGATLIYLITTTVSVGIAYFTIWILGSGNEVPFGEWLFKSGEEVSFEISYALGAIILISFIFSAMYYYFSVRLIRMSVLLLLIFITMILYVRGPYTSYNIAVYTYLLCFFIIYIKNNFIGEDNASDKLKLKYKNYIGFSIVIILGLFLVSMFIPISKAFPEIDFLTNARNILREYSLSAIFRGFSTENNSYRKTNESVSDNNYIVLYSYRGEKVNYFISHTFDYYNLTEESWIENNSDFKQGESINIGTKYNELEVTKNILEKSDSIDEKLALINNAESDENLYKSIIIKSEYKSFDKMIHPSKTYEIEGDNRGIYLNKYEEVFLENNNLFEVGIEYKEYFLKDEPEEGSKENLIMKTFNKELYEKYLYEDFLLYDLGKEVNNIFDIYTTLDVNTSKRIKELAIEITKDKESYYDKGKAIEEFFKSGEYFYNMSLPSTNSSDFIDYFIFEGKEGYCVQYATAMTLMCRSIGIPTRYTEGYLVSEEDRIEEGYEFNAYRAHAFVEMYIPGYGWKIFDPTPSRLSEDESEGRIVSTRSTFNLNINLRIFLGTIAILIIVYLGSFIILKTTKRRRVLRKILKKPTEEAFEGLIFNSIILLKEINIEIRKGETILRFSERVDKKINVGFNELIKKYYSKKYGCLEIDKSDLEFALRNNKEIFKLIKEEKKNNNK